MRRTVDRPNALKAATAPGVLEMLQASNTSLEKIHKCLEVSAIFNINIDGEIFAGIMFWRQDAAYVESKRLA